MAEQANMAVMGRDEFEERHARTGQWIARVEKIWEGIAEEQQAIIDGKGYRYLGYQNWPDYWNNEWSESGWSAKAAENWLTARRIKRGVEASSELTGYTPTSVDQWKQLGTLEPERRTEFLKRYDEFKPDRGSSGGHPFREAIKEFKGEREPTVADVLSPEVLRDLPPGEMPTEQKWHHRTASIAAAIEKLDPADVAAYNRNPKLIDAEVRWAEQIAAWYGAYADELKALKGAPLKAVKGGKQ